MEFDIKVQDLAMIYNWAVISTKEVDMGPKRVFMVSFRHLKITRKVVNTCLPPMKYLFDAAVVRENFFRPYC
jgi:hypothetical protein